MIQRYKHAMIVSIIDGALTEKVTRLDETLSLQEEDDGYVRKAKQAGF